MANIIKYHTEEERKKARKEDYKRWAEKNKKKERERLKQWKKEHPVESRAHSLIMAYNAEDIKRGRGKGNLTVKWVIDNIFSQPCAHCGRTGWDVIGCNRLDNDKPHTMDNVEPCCRECNDKLHHKDLEKVVKQIDIKTNTIIKIWNSIKEASKHLGIHESSIIRCCKGRYFCKSRNVWVNINSAGGFKWSY